MATLAPAPTPPVINYTVDPKAPLPLRDLLRTRLSFHLPTEKTEELCNYLFPIIGEFFLSCQRNTYSELRFSKDSLANRTASKKNITAASGWLKTLPKIKVYLQVISCAKNQSERIVGKGASKVIKASDTFIIIKNGEEFVVEECYPSVLWQKKDTPVGPDHDYSSLSNMIYEINMYQKLSILLPPELLAETPIQFKTYRTHKNLDKLEFGQRRYLCDAKALYESKTVPLNVDATSVRPVEIEDSLKVLQKAAYILKHLNAHGFVNYDSRFSNFCLELVSGSLRIRMIDLEAIDPVNTIIDSGNDSLVRWDEMLIKFQLLTPQTHVIQMAYMIANAVTRARDAIQSNSKQAIMSCSFQFQMVKDFLEDFFKQSIQIFSADTIEKLAVKIEEYEKNHKIYEYQKKTFKEVKIKVLLTLLMNEIFKNDIEMNVELQQTINLLNSSEEKRNAAIEYYEKNKALYFSLETVIRRLYFIEEQLTK